MPVNIKKQKQAFSIPKGKIRDFSANLIIKTCKTQTRNLRMDDKLYLLELFLPQAVGKAGRVALLVQIHLHELLDGQLAGGRVPELLQSDRATS